MLNFVKKIIFFTLPLMSVFVVPVVVIVLGKEYFSINQVIEAQTKHPDGLFGFVYNGQSFIPYKQLLVEKNNPEIIALGTSRVMQFRKEFFINQGGFINAGGGAKNLYDVRQFIQDLPETSDTKVVLLGLDQDMFTSKENTLSYVQKEDSSFDIWKQVLFVNVRKIYMDYMHQKYTLKNLIDQQESSSVGIAAIVNGDGFRGDGSYRYGSILSEEGMVSRVRKQVKDTVLTIRHGRYASFMSSGREEKNMEVLRSVLELARSKNIEIIGFFPPYPQALYLHMKEGDNYYSDTINLLPKMVNSVMSNAGFVFFDFSDATVFGAPDSEFVDNIHASDKMHVRMLLVMAKESPALKKYVNIQKLQKLLDSSKENILTF